MIHQASTSEPEIVRGMKPEKELQGALKAVVESILTQAGANFILLEGFGLDIATFIQRNDRNYVRMIEVKAYVGSRPNSVGLGDRKGIGSQVDLLIQPSEKLKIVDSSICWVLGMGEFKKQKLKKGSPRYAVFTSIQAKKAVVGKGVSRGKQNNIGVLNFENELVTWGNLQKALRKFLLERQAGIK